MSEERNYEDAFLIHLLLLLSLSVAECVHGTTSANQKSRRTKGRPRSQRLGSLEDRAFNTNIERLPPSFKGDNMKRLYDTLERIPEKSKMESTPAFYERLEKAVD